MKKKQNIAVDESGEDYAFVTDRFYPVELPQAAGRTHLNQA
jgi:hypothetical protein